MLGHTHILIAGATWVAVWWRPVTVGGATLGAPVFEMVCRW
jgi:hypothetical protein